MTIGDKEENVDTQLGDNNVMQAESITNTYEGMEEWQLLLLVFLAGVAIPDFSVMGRGFINLLRTLLPWS